MTHPWGKEMNLQKCLGIGDMCSFQEDACCWVSSILLRWFFPVSSQITNWWTSVLNTKIIHLMTPTRMYISWPKHGSLRMINSCHQHTCVHVYHVYIYKYKYTYISLSCIYTHESLCMHRFTIANTWMYIYINNIYIYLNAYAHIICIYTNT